MCLISVKNFNVRNHAGYVVKEKRGHCYYPIYKNKDVRLELGKARRAISIGEIGCLVTIDRYKPGWHIFTNLKEAIVYRNEFRKAAVVLRVKYRNIFARGEEHFYHDYMYHRHHHQSNHYANVVVAEWMTLLEEVKGANK